MSKTRKLMYSLQDDAESQPSGGRRKRGSRTKTTRANYLNRGSNDPRPISQSRKQSEFHIVNTFESLNYTPLTSQIELEAEKATTYSKIKIYGIFRIGIFMLTGVLVALIGVFLELTSDHFGYLKYSIFEQVALNQFDGTFKEFLVFVVYRLIGTMVPVLLGAAMVVFIAPHAAGGGVAQSIAFLNGVNVPNVLSFKGLIVKVLSTSCVVISGLAGGKEGPMMHMGTATGGSLPSVFPCTEFKLENERRDFAAAGFGCGLACVFGAPVGGLLLALEEGVSFLEITLMWKIYLCCVVGYALGTIVMSMLHYGNVDLTDTDLLTLGKIPYDITEYNAMELFPFAFMAVIGGLIGAFLTIAHVHVVGFRNKYVKTKTRKMIVAIIAALVVVFFQVISIWFMRTCSEILPESEEKESSPDFNKTSTSLHRLYCPEGKRSDMSLLFSKTQGDLLRIFFGKDLLQISSLGLFCVIYFLLMQITMITPISAGIFIPQIIMGAAWGRMFGTFLKEVTNNADWAKPAKYAYLGAAAQLSGTTGKTFSILVIFVEASANVHLSFPLMVIVTITRIVSTFFIIPIYETQMHITGFPFLSHKAPPVDCDIPTSDIMSQPPLVTLSPSPTVRTIISTLRGNAHNGFPIVETRPEGDVVLVGLILRQQLLIILKYQAYLYPPPTTNKQMCECYFTYMKESRIKLDEDKIFESVDEEHFDDEIDLRPYYSLHPKCVTDDLPMIKTYELFRTLGERHIVVITKNHEPVGMITRKDLAKFHTVESYCRVKVKEMVVH